MLVIYSFVSMPRENVRVSPGADRGVNYLVYLSFPRYQLVDAADTLVSMSEIPTEAM